MRRAPLAAAVFLIATLAAMSFSAVLAITSPAVWEVGFPGVFWSIPFAAIALIGALLVWRRGANATGWVLAASGLLMVGNAAFQDYTFFAYSADPPRLMAATSSWLGFWTWIPATQMMAIFFLIFPTGSVVSRAWRPVLWGAVALVIGSVLSAIPVWGSRGPDLLEAPTPAALPGGDLMYVLGNFGFMVLALAGLSSLVIRYRRAEQGERYQIKWLLLASGLTVGALGLAGIVAAVENTPDPMSAPIVVVGSIVAMTSIPIAAAIAILRHRLYDIDVVINKAIVFGALAAFITAVYVAVVVGVGTMIGARANPVLSAAAAALVALAFQPVRQRSRHLANRLVYGKRATPYEVLSHLSDRVAGGYSVDEALPQIAKIISEGTGAVGSEIWLRVGGELRRAAAHPDGSSPGETIEIGNQERLAIPGADRTFPVRHQEELLGAIAVRKAPGDPILPTEEKLLSDVASQAGLLLRNVRLLEELRASRQRLVRAQDEERRRMERDIHDGAQQQLVAIAVKMGLIENLIPKDPDKAAEILRTVKVETSEAVETVRDLARGLYPSLLTDKGLVAALEAHIAKMSINAVVQADAVTGIRFDEQAEAAFYFCIREALQNASKHASDSQITVRMDRGDDRLEFEVTDNGPGFDPDRIVRGSGLQNMRDRIEALGGTFEMISSPGQGTRVMGRVPAEEKAG